MKALSIRQPWAWAILHAGKRIENRDWRGCYYRGPLLIHAAKGMTRDEHAEATLWIQEQFGLVAPSDGMLDRGGIVGVCNVVGAGRLDPATGHIWEERRTLNCQNGCGGVWGVAYDRSRRCPKASPWAFGPLGLVLADVRRLPFVPFKGALGFFDVPDDLVPGARL